ncbi:MAG: hypothetical protein AB4372_18220 [Xenococcus sp. (in: cyanobacteria)]
MTQLQEKELSATLKEFEALPQPSSCRLIDFEKAEVRPGIVNGTYILIVKGVKPYLNMKVDLVPLVYVRQPEYWANLLIRDFPKINTSKSMQ